MRINSAQLAPISVLLFMSVFNFQCSGEGPAMEEILITDIATDATDPCDLPDNEPCIAVNPKNLQEIVVLTFSEGWGRSICKNPQDLKNAPIWRSNDGGQTWEKVFVLPPALPRQEGPYDQRAIFDSSGHLFISAMDQGSNAFVYRQSDDGSTELIPGMAYGNDQPLIDVDRATSSKCFNRVYSPWNNTTNTPNAISMVSNSTNSGAAFLSMKVGNDNFPNRTARIAIAPDGTVYAIYKTQEGQIDNRFENARFRVIRSDDCGATWNGAAVGGVPVNGDAAARTWFTQNKEDGFGNVSKGGKVNRARSSDAWIAVDPRNGDVYAAFVNIDSSGFSQIFVARSSDKGETWKITRVADDGHNCAFPEIAVAGNGTVGVLYIDYDDSGDTTIFRHLFSRSFDQGETYDQKVLQSMDPVNVSNDEPDFLWGDYEGLTAEGDSFYGAFTGESINRRTRQLDPIFFKAPAAP
jgi:hypothetical protein